MKRLALAVVAVAAVGLTACQKQAAPARSAEAEAPAENASGAAPAEAPATQAPAPSRPVAAPPASAAQQAPARTEPAAAPRAEPAPAAPAPAAPPPPRELAAGTSIPLVLQTTVASNTSHVEDRVLAEVAEDVVADGRVVLPEGAEVIGHVVAAVPSGRVKGRARLAVRFEEVRVGGVSYVLDATGIDVTAASAKGRDAKVAGGATAAGAIIGAIAGGGKGALKGGAIGAAAGGAAVLATKGDEVEFRAGQTYKVKLESRLQVE